jgi:uncharacterized membrane protein
MKKLRIAGIALLVFLVLAAAAYVIHARRRTLAGAARPTVTTLFGGEELPRAPEGVRIRVQVLNTTKTRGLARRATRLLRDRGFDVVEMGTTGPLRDTTLVLDRSGHAEWAATVAKVLGPARAEARTDSSRYLDVTVLLGSSWRAPAEPLDP